MERWEYAAGTNKIDGTWSVQSQPGDYESARTALEALIRTQGDEGWVIDPRIVKRSDRHPSWVPVYDHAAELLAEILTDLALRFAANGNDIMQAKDLNRVIKHVAFSLKPDNVEEYGE